ncbi:MAG: efflux RND transporter periplasmic adaptor subunit [Acidobacteriota bacterium]|nr:MAG: efflux RND transporter periplasmic adaptor subunit [Acidobacteriota bacterium]
MHPTYMSNQPGACPICGMDIVEVEEEGHGGHEDDASTPEGYATVKLSPERQQLIGVRTAAVERRALTKKLRTVGVVQFDEDRIYHTHLKVNGWIEEAFVTYEGQKLYRGQPLFTLYSPELFATEQEFVLALETVRKIGKGEQSEAALGAQAILEAARQRLQLWDIEPREIERLESTRKPQRAVTFHSYMDGFVERITMRHGMYVTPEMELFSLADLSWVWVEAAVYEYELGLIKEGQNAWLTLSYFPGRRFYGKVIYIYPTLDAKTRTARVRFEFENPEFHLKPDMYANVNMEIPLGRALSVPRDVVLDTGTRKIVFVALGDGRFEPRDITVGREAEGYYEVLGGLREGDEVVTNANFMIDSESRIKAALDQMTAGGHEGH